MDTCPTKSWSQFRRHQRDLIYRSRFKITLEDYEVLWEKQEGKCKICKKEEVVTHWKSKERQILSIDHDHKTGKVRGLLCARCNHAIGNMEDNKEFLYNAISYLEAA